MAPYSMSSVQEIITKPTQRQEKAQFKKIKKIT